MLSTKTHTRYYVKSTLLIPSYSEMLVTYNKFNDFD